MSTVQEIAAAIEKLPKKDFWELTDRLVAMREEAWDRQIEDDAKAGKLDRLYEQADRDFEAGRCKEL